MILTENNVYEMLMDLKDILNAVQNIAEQYYKENKKLEENVKNLNEKNMFLQRELETQDEEHQREIETLQEKYDNYCKEEKSRYMDLKNQYDIDREQMRKLDIQLACLADEREYLMNQKDKLDEREKELNDKEATYKSNYDEYKKNKDKLDEER